MLTVTWACPKGTAQGLHWGNCKQPRVALRPRLGACSSIGQRYSLQTGCSSVADASRSLRLVTRCEREKSWGEIASEFGDAVKDVGQKLAKPFKKDAELQQRKQEEKTLKKNISDALGGGLVGNLVGGMLGSVVGMAAQTFKEGLQTSQAVYERAQKEIKLDKRVEDFIGTATDVSPITSQQSSSMNINGQQSTTVRIAFQVRGSTGSANVSVTDVNGDSTIVLTRSDGQVLSLSSGKGSAAGGGDVIDVDYDIK